MGLTNKILQGLSVGVVMSIFLVVLFHLSVFEGLELKSLDYRFRRVADPTRASRDIVIVTVDQSSIDSFKDKAKVYWPWPREYYGRLIDFLRRGNPRAILFDIYFSEPDIDRLDIEGVVSDGALIRATEEAGNVYHSMIFRSDREKNSSEALAEELLLERGPLSIGVRSDIKFSEYESVILPIPELLRAARQVGGVNIIPDADGVCRRSDLFFKYGDHVFPSLSLTVAQDILKSGRLVLSSDNHLQIGRISVPLDSEGKMIINWHGIGGPAAETYVYYPFYSLLLSEIQIERGINPSISPTEFEDKIVLVGSNAPALFDLKPTPFSAYSPYPGVEIHATVIDNLLNNDFVSRWDRKSAIGILVLVCLSSTVIFFAISSAPLRALAGVGCVLIYFLISLIIFAKFRLWIDLVAPEVALFLTLTVSALVSYFTEDRARRQFKNAFSKYLAPEVVEEISKDFKSLNVNIGTRKEMSVLFADIRGFTTMSERMPSEDVVAMLNEYLASMTKVIFDNHGTLDKYLGDGIMVFFGAPKHTADHALLAVKTALEMAGEFESLKQRWMEGGKPVLEIGIAIDSGPMVVGNIGCDQRLDYTVIGDHVNLADRLEKLNKIYGTNIIISESTFNEVKDLAEVKDLGFTHVSGREKEVHIFELLGLQAIV